MGEVSKQKLIEQAFSSIYSYLTYYESNQKYEIDQVASLVCGEDNFDNCDYHVKEALLLAIKNTDEIKEKIANNLRGWTYDRVSLINKSILFYAITEYFYTDNTPKALIIDVSIKLVKKFGEEKDYKFINGILDKILVKENN